MEIGKNWRIESDEMNITLLHRVHVPATQKMEAHYNWVTKGYYATMAGALKDLVDWEVAKTGLKDVETVVAKQEKLYRLIDKVVK